MNDGGVAKHLRVILAVVLCVLATEALPVFQEEYDYDGHHHEHHALPPATSYATISTTHVKVQHPPASYPKYPSLPYKYEYEPNEQPRTAYKYITLSEALALQRASGGKYEEQRPSTPGYKYLAASPTYKYVQPPAVTTEPEAAEEPTNSLKYALKYEQSAYKQHEYSDQPAAAVRYVKYVTVPSYKYVQQQQQEQQEQQEHAVQAPDYSGEQHQLAAAAVAASSTYDFAGDDDKQQY